VILCIGGADYSYRYRLQAIVLIIGPPRRIYLLGSVARRRRPKLTGAPAPTLWSRRRAVYPHDAEIDHNRLS